MNQVTNRKLYLRVALKLMFIAAMLFVAFIFIRYSFQANDKTGMVSIDLSGLPAGETQIVRLDGREILILHRTQAMLASLGGVQQASPYLIIYRQSPDYSCPLEIVMPGDAGQGGFRAVCSGTLYNFAGQLLPGQNARFNLQQPEYSLKGKLLLLGSKK